MKINKLKPKKVYIVGTGITAALISKKLKDVVMDSSGEFINRTDANNKFKEVLVSIKYLNNVNNSINNGFYERKEKKSDYEKEVELALDKISTISKTNILTNDKKNELFEDFLFQEFFSEVEICLIEAGLKAGVDLDSTANFLNYNSYLNRFNNAPAKVPNSPYPELRQAGNPDVLAIEKISPSDKSEPSMKGYLVQKGPMPFLSDSTRVGGGTTMHWLGSTPRMLPNDFSLFKSDASKKEKYEWPIHYDEIRPYYEIAEYEIGVSGNSKDQHYPGVTSHSYYGDEYEFPMQEISKSYLDSIIERNLTGRKVELGSETVDIHLNTTPQGRNSTPNSSYKSVPSLTKNGSNYQFKLNSNSEAYKALGAVWNPYMGERCEGNASCVPICPVQAKYNALKSLKKAVYRIDWRGDLKLNQSVEIKAQSVVYKLSVGDESKVSKIHFRHYEAENDVSFTEEVINTEDALVILAGNAIENPKILLNSKYKKTGKSITTVANSSDQVGRNLMDHLVMLVWGYASEPVYPYRGPSSTMNISSFRDGEFRQEHSAWFTPISNWGWAWPTFSPGSDLDALLEKKIYGKALRDGLKESVTRQVTLQFEIEQLPNEHNRVTIDDNYIDVLGIPRPIIEYNVSEYEKKALAKAREVSKSLFGMLNIEDKTEFSEDDPAAVFYDGKLYNYKGAGHIVGTHRMGNKKENSVTDSYCKAWDHPNLYVVGTGSMPTLGTSNPTLTSSALAIRSVESILKDLGN